MTLIRLNTNTLFGALFSTEANIQYIPIINIQVTSINPSAKLPTQCKQTATLYAALNQQ